VNTADLLKPVAIDIAFSSVSYVALL